MSEIDFKNIQGECQVGRVALYFLKYSLCKQYKINFQQFLTYIFYIAFQRLQPEVAANVCQLLLWAPSSWLKAGLVKPPSSAEILQWLLSLTTKVLCEGRINRSSASRDKHERERSFGRRTYPEYLLISSFLCRAKLSNIKSALSWIHDVNYYD